MYIYTVQITYYSTTGRDTVPDTARDAVASADRRPMVHRLSVRRTDAREGLSGAEDRRVLALFTVMRVSVLACERSSSIWRGS